MLNFFPHIYPDELWSSVVARAYKYSGYVTCKSFAQEIFKGKQECLNNIFINSYKKDFTALINKVSGPKVVVEHTLIPFYLLTSGSNKKQLYKKALKYDRGINKNLAVPKNIDCHLKYCPICYKEEIEQFGEPYWHVSHQVLNYCPKHCCKLIVSSIPYTRSKCYSFTPLSDIVLDNTSQSILDESNINIMFDRYIANVLREITTFANNSISDYLRSVIPDCYFKDVRRERINSKKLFSDITNFYSDLIGINRLTPYRIRSILNSTQINVRDYLLISYFLGLSPEAASKAKVMKQENKTVGRITSLYQKSNSIHYVSRVMGLDRRVVRCVIKNTKVLGIIN